MLLKSIVLSSSMLHSLRHSLCVSPPAVYSNNPTQPPHHSMSHSHVASPSPLSLIIH